MTATAARIEPFDEVRAIVEDAIAAAGPEYHTGLLALEIRDRIRTERPDLWDAWVDMMAVDALKTSIGRARGLHRRPTSVFRRGGFDLTESVDSSHTQRRFGDCVRSDLDYIARRYSKQAATMKQRAAAIRAIRDRLPTDTARVRDHVPESDVEAIFA